MPTTTRRRHRAHLSDHESPRTTFFHSHSAHPFCNITRDQLHSAPAQWQGHRIVRSSRSHMRYSSAPTQSSEPTAPVSSSARPTRLPGRLAVAPRIPAATWCIPHRVAQGPPPSVGSEGLLRYLRVTLTSRLLCGRYRRVLCCTSLRQP